MAEESHNYNCAITGASGYVGSRISAYLSRKGWSIYELNHGTGNPAKNNGPVIDYSLDRAISSITLRGINVLIHCAYDFRPLHWKRINEVNVKGSVQLFDAANKAGVKKIIFISTMSAFTGCKSIYGKAKLEIETEALKIGATVIRPGLVFGNDAGGLIAALCQMVCAAKFIPLIGRGNQVLHLVHEQDLCRLVYKIVQNEGAVFSKPIVAASEKGKTLKQILSVLTDIQKKKVVFIPIPWVLVWSGLKLVEIVGLRVAFRSDSLISLLNQEQNPDFGLTRRTGIAFREFDSTSLVSPT